MSRTGDFYTGWNNTDGSISGIINFGTISTDTLIGSNFSSTKIIPDKNWMPYPYVEYEPIWHKKFASYKNQMKEMWK